MTRKIFPLQSYLRKKIKIFVIFFHFFPMYSLLFPVCVCVCKLFRFLEKHKEGIFLFKQMKIIAVYAQLKQLRNKA